MKRRKIKQSIYRILLSEVLPYELPLIFSNSRFYHIADKLRLKLVNNKLEHKATEKNIKWADAFVLLLNGTNTIKSSFNYYINKLEGEKARELVVVHPFAQLEILDLYMKYDSLILNFCQKSNFSLRYPHKRATFLRPKRNISKTAEKFLDYKANDNPKHYFHYLKYQNINGFYDGNQFQRLESRFKHMFKTDIHHCFDDIPVMDLPQKLYQSSETIIKGNNFASKFSLLMKEMNNGKIYQDPTSAKGKDIKDKSESVVIGPEFSRIFAEMFLQQLDLDIERKMKNGRKKYELHFDYECFRYVDDIFFFFNDNAVKTKFERILKLVLYNSGEMKLNPSKECDSETPFVQGITVAKRELNVVVCKLFDDRLNTIMGFINREFDNHYDFPIRMQAQHAIIDLKTIIKRENVKFSEVSSSLLSNIHRHLAKSLDEIDTLMNDYRKANENDMLDKVGKDIWIKYEKDLVYFLREIIKFILYIFNNDIRMSTSIRVVSILNIILSYCKGTLFNDSKVASKSLLNDSKNKIFKSIVDGLIFVLKTNKMSMLNGLEISNLMLIMKEIPNNYNILPDIWNKFINDTFNIYDEQGNTSFLVALTLLELFGSDKAYSFNRNTICEWLIQDLDMHDWSVDDTECLMIMVNMITSSFVDESFKSQIVSKVDKKFSEALSVISERKSPFMQWDEFNLTKACQIKYSAEVY